MFEILLSGLMDSLLEVMNLALKYEKAVTEATHFHTLILKETKAHDVPAAGQEMADHLVQSKQAIIYAEKNIEKAISAKRNNKL